MVFKRCNFIKFNMNKYLNRKLWVLRWRLTCPNGSNRFSDNFLIIVNQYKFSLSNYSRRDLSDVYLHNQLKINTHFLFFVSIVLKDVSAFQTNVLALLILHSLFRNYQLKQVQIFLEEITEETISYPCNTLTDG